MAKKPLKRPALPRGKRLEFLLSLQAVVLRHGDLSVAQLAAKAGFSHQAIYKALTGPKVPSRNVTEAIVDCLASSDEKTAALGLWTEAVAEERLMESGRVRESSEESAVAARDELSRVLTQAYRQTGFKLHVHGERAGYGRSRSYDILAGRYLPSWDRFASFARALGVDPSSVESLYNQVVSERDQGRLSRGQ